MPEFLRGLEKAAELLLQKAEQRAAISSELQKIAERNNLFVSLKRIKPNLSIAGIDSGFTGISLLSMELVLIKAAGVVFHYKNGTLEKTIYEPEFVGFPKIAFSEALLQPEDFGANKSLQRLKAEIGLAIQIIRKYSPALCLLDGSIVLQHADKPRNNSKIKPLYLEVLKLFEELYRVAEKNKTVLVGCVEDSRGTRFVELLAELYDFKAQTYDVSLLEFALKEGYRTISFSYAKEPEKHPILSDLDKDLAEKIKVFYLRASNFDLPLRIEYLNSSYVNEQELANILYSISSMNRNYSYPSVLIEADLRARLKPEEIELAKEKLFSKLHTKIFFLRRDRRPF